MLRIVYTRTGRGLDQDALLLVNEARRLGIGVEVRGFERESESALRWANLWYRVRRRLPARIRQSAEMFARLVDRYVVPDRRWPQVPLQIHLESPRPRMLARARVNWLIPNQEWLSHLRMHLMPGFDTVLCKTHHACEALAPWHRDIKYLGFSSPEENYRDIADRDLGFALHVAGNGLAKGTRALVEAWDRHAEWPTLVVVANNPSALLSGLELNGHTNLEFRSSVPGSELTTLRAAAGWVMAASEIEGFGHVIFEGLLAGSCVVTTDAPPMNELVTEERGFLARWSESKPQRMGIRFGIDSVMLEEDLARVFATSETDILRRARAGRTYAEQHSRLFRERFIVAIGTIQTENRGEVLQPGDR